MTTLTSSKLIITAPEQTADIIRVDYYDSRGVGYDNITGKPSIPKGTKPLPSQNIEYIDDLGFNIVPNDQINPEVARGKLLAQGFDSYIAEMNERENARKFYESRTGFQKMDNRTVYSQPNSYLPIINPISALPDADVVLNVQPVQVEAVPFVPIQEPLLPANISLREKYISATPTVPFQNIQGIEYGDVRVKSKGHRKTSSDGAIKDIHILNTITPQEGGSQPYFAEGYMNPTASFKEKGKSRKKASTIPEYLNNQPSLVASTSSDTSRFDAPKIPKPKTAVIVGKKAKEPVIVGDFSPVVYRDKKGREVFRNSLDNEVLYIPQNTQNDALRLAGITPTSPRPLVPKATKVTRPASVSSQTTAEPSFASRAGDFARNTFRKLSGGGKGKGRKK